jgi:molybdate/tungstate transport system permease protein
VAVVSSVFLLFIVDRLRDLSAQAARAPAALAGDSELRQSAPHRAHRDDGHVARHRRRHAHRALLARRTFRGKAFLAAIMDLPLVIPHPVAESPCRARTKQRGRLGAVRRGAARGGIADGNHLRDGRTGPTVRERRARVAFARVDARFEAVARTLGDDAWRAFARDPAASARTSRRRRSSCGRAVSEFGAIVILTYNPKVASVLSYDRFTAFGLNEALPVAAVLVLLALVPLAALRALRRE